MTDLTPQYLDLPVEGRCPSCEKEELALSSSGEIYCVDKACARPKAVTEILKNASTKHIVKLTSYNFSVQHPLIERLEDGVFECELVKELTYSSNPPKPTGVYQVVRTSTGWDWSRCE